MDAYGTKHIKDMLWQKNSLDYLLLSQLEEKGDRAVCGPEPSSVSSPSEAIAS